FPGSPQDSLQLGVFRITRVSVMVCLPTGYLHQEFPLAINCYHSSPTAAACTGWGGGHHRSCFPSLLIYLRQLNLMCSKFLSLRVCTKTTV
ncbi:unnamed protein product, partial [Bubo scandiacus]